MEHATRIGNRLLAALPPADFDLLAPSLKKVTLERDAVLVHTGDPVTLIHFPCTAMLSFNMDLPDGQTVATAMIGKEGASGILTSIAPVPSPVTTVVRLPGTAWQMPPEQFHAALRKSAAIANLVQMYTQALVAQLQHVAACNALHPVEQRMARWLLYLHDHVHGDEVPVTQEALAELLGVRRPTVTLVASRLKASGVIRSNRRGAIEVDRPRLEAASCECYKVMAARIDRIISRHAPKPRAQTASAHKPSRRDSPTAEPGS